ncbi:anthranilate phosphoribosyltransferase [Helicobacter canis]|uniref:anthranilate phosphoribosyltransferase n=1 Tax=Helicobacter canis TaxID=29419 RepID=UPI002941CEA4|nr:anthranilate phosphoribosyltransferase [Helicobacter canis]
MIKDSIIALAKGQTLTYTQAKQAMDEIMSQEASDIQIAAFLTALALKGESIDEITACAESLREHCVRLLHNMEVLEIVGTGGDGSNSFNISTASAIVSAAGGAKVAKHGNRSASSQCGSADVLEELGVNIMLDKERSQRLLEEIGICFLFAQNYHIAMRYVAPVRKQLGIRTIFNILGPLSNPAGASLQLMGVYDESLCEPLAQVMRNLGVKRGMVVYGQDSLDEISLSAPTRICEISEDAISSYMFSPKEFGLELCDKAALQGGDKRVNAQILRDIFSGQDRGAKYHATCLNAGAALYIAGKAESFKDGFYLARKLIDQKSAQEKLNAFIAHSHSPTPKDLNAL